jgi:hypothetical protein
MSTRARTVPPQQSMESRTVGAVTTLSGTGIAGHLAGAGRLPGASKPGHLWAGVARRSRTVGGCGPPSAQAQVQRLQRPAGRQTRTIAGQAATADAGKAGQLQQRAAQAGRSPCGARTGLRIGPRTDPRTDTFMPPHRAWPATTGWKARTLGGGGAGPVGSGRQVWPPVARPASPDLSTGIAGRLVHPGDASRRKAGRIPTQVRTQDLESLDGMYRKPMI